MSINKVRSKPAPVRLTRQAVIGGSRQGIAKISYDELVAKLGQPERYTGDKVQAEWVVKYRDTVLTVYDYKSSTLPEQQSTWHIGGRNDNALWAFEEIFPNTHVFPN